MNAVDILSFSDTLGSAVADHNLMESQGSVGDIMKSSGIQKNKIAGDPITNKMQPPRRSQGNAAILAGVPDFVRAIRYHDLTLWSLEESVRVLLDQ